VWTSFINTCFNDLLHLLYPHVCPGCGSDAIAGEQLICLDCMLQVPVTNFYMHPGNPVEKMFGGRLPLVSATSHVYFTKRSVMQNLLHQLKYRGNKEVGLYFGRQMGASFGTAAAYSDVHGLIPLPLHFRKQKKRGYNQAAVICEGIREVTGIPVLTDVVARGKETATQTRKNRVQRWDNIAGKFILANTKPIESKHVLLVDDVITTGATIEACGSELLKAKGTRLSVASLAYTIR